VFEVLERCLDSAAVKGVNHVQLRGQKRSMTTCTVKNGVVEEFSSIKLNGVGARAFIDSKSWGFSSTNKLDVKSVSQTLRDAVKLARASSKQKKQKVKLESVKGAKADVKVQVKKPLQNYSSEDIAKISLDACKGAREVGRQVVDTKATYISIEDEKYFLSSEGSRIHQSLSRVLLLVDVIAKSNSVICPVSENLGHAGGFELFEKTSPYSLARAVAEKAVRLLDAKAPPSGKFRVVVHPTLCATLLHEAIGHPLEADLAMSGGASEIVLARLCLLRL